MTIDTDAQEVSASEREVEETILAVRDLGRKGSQREQAQHARTTGRQALQRRLGRTQGRGAGMWLDMGGHEHGS